MDASGSVVIYDTCSPTDPTYMLDETQLSNPSRLKFKEKNSLNITKKTKQNNIIQRVSTSKYDMIKDIVDSMDTNQPPFTEDDLKKHSEIWGYRILDKGKCTSVFSNEIFKIGIGGDHVADVRASIQEFDIMGSNSRWNLIPCSHKENVSWKRFTVKGKKSITNILLLSDSQRAELDLPKDKLEFVDKFKKWEAYCLTRGAKMYYTGARKYDAEVHAVAVEVHSLMDAKTRAIIERLSAN